MFGVSRTSVRAALQNLQGRGIIVTMQGVGSFVHKTPNEQNVPGVDITSDISSDEFKDFFEFRQAIEFKAIDVVINLIAEGKPASVVMIHNILFAPILNNFLYKKYT